MSMQLVAQRRAAAPPLRTSPRRSQISLEPGSKLVSPVSQSLATVASAVLEMAEVAKPSKGPSKTVKAVFIALCVALLLVIVSALLALKLFKTEPVPVDPANYSDPTTESRVWFVNLTTDDLSSEPSTKTPSTTISLSTAPTTLLQDLRIIEEVEEEPTSTAIPSTSPSSTTTEVPTTTESVSTSSTLTTAARSPATSASTSSSTSTTTTTTAEPSTTSTFTSTTTVVPTISTSDTCAKRMENLVCRSQKFVPSDSLNPEQWEEAFIASAGHLSGFRPLLYRLNLTVPPLAKDTLAGNAEIRIESIADSNAVALHADRSIGDIDRVSLWDCTTGEEICVKTTTHLLAQQIVVFELASTVSKGLVLELSIGVFQSRPSVGIHRSRAQQWERSRASTLGTVFQMRKARNAFPCFDLPVFKAEMELCLTYPRGIHARSNTPVISTSPSSSCFARTPKIPSYLLAFSLLTKLHRVEMKLDFPELPTVEVLGRSHMEASSLDWVFNETFQTLHKMREMTGVAYPLEKLSLVVSSLPDALQGIENLGLVTIQESAIEYPKHLRSHAILAHQIVHQWIGDLVTVSSWKDVCLQHGLTGYLEWLITSKFASLEDSNVDERCREAKMNSLHREIGKFNLIDNFRELDQALNVCGEKAPVVFHMLDNGFGHKLIPRFVKLLLEKFAWRSVGFENWIEVLNDAAKTTFAGDMLNSYFSQPGYPLVLVDFKPHKPLRISQRHILGDSPFSDNSSLPFVVPLEIDDSSAERKTRFVILKGQEQTEEPIAANWVVADPLSVTYSRIVYSVDNYNGIAKCVADQNCEFPEKVLENVVGDFCWALLKDVFTTSPGEVQSWKKLLTSLAASKVASGDCGCCLDVANRNSRYCKWTWVDRCQKISLLKTLTDSEGPRRGRGRN
ncbi:hypothetical protein L596_024321 [Steinernema carpocapsae]|uniref:Uncharacterized protein n=1 Tax=Steinernema carpocapsae TaxID=34508 RepID=A0A4V5ZZP2_STECR|nr:hypothetical protein L596_024321 [Steinernema carpocapsae]